MSKKLSTIERLRRRKRMSQTALAHSVGVSQASISRFEKGEQQPTFSVLAKIARALDVELDDVVDANTQHLLQQNDDSSAFFAFCPNPLCSSNHYERNARRQAVVQWKSGRSYAAHDWDDINFCPTCRTELVKECSTCHRRLMGKSKFCIKCGSLITERPTTEDWTEIEKRLKEEDDFDDDIPF